MKYLGWLIVSCLSTAYDAFVFAMGWSWFVVPLGSLNSLELGYVHIFGLVLLGLFVARTVRKTPTTEDDHKLPEDHRIAVNIGIRVVLATWTLALLWFASILM